jgi:hypothetical protein
MQSSDVGDSTLVVVTGAVTIPDHTYSPFRLWTPYVLVESDYDERETKTAKGVSLAVSARIVVRVPLPPDQAVAAVRENAMWMVPYPTGKEELQVEAQY